MRAVDALFLFLAEDAPPDGERIEQLTAGGVNAFAWVSDADAAVTIAAEQAAAGLRLLELYRGFDLGAAGKVIEAVGGAVPVGVSAFGYGSRSAAPRHSVAIYGADIDDPAVRRFDVDLAGTRTAVVPVADAEGAVRAAEEAVAAGAGLVEICGGTPLTTAALVAATVGDRATVALVSWPFESITGAAAYKAAFEAA